MAVTDAGTTRFNREVQEMKAAFWIVVSVSGKFRLTRFWQLAKALLPMLTRPLPKSTFTRPLQPLKA